jgi:cell division protein FtsB
MKAWMAVIVLAATPLVGCGNSREQQRARIELNTLRKDTDTLRAENTALKQKVTELEGQVAGVTKERDDLRAAADEQAASNAVVPASGSSKKRSGKK